MDCADFTFVYVHFLTFGDPEVGRAVAASAMARSSISVTELAIRGVKNPKAGDMNRDGKVDMSAVKLFVARYMKR